MKCCSFVKTVSEAKMNAIIAFLLVLAVQVVLSVASPKLNRDLVIVIADGGADDASALIQVLQASVRVVAVLCSYGNVRLNQACNNIRRTLKLMGKEDEIPVFAGCDKPLARTASFDGFFGFDGMGNNSHKFPLPKEKVMPSHAANALNYYANRYPGKISVLSLGPVTDLAVALRLDSSMPSKLKHLYIMGGTSRAEGNISPVSEFNIHDDPEAAHVVFSEYSCPITVSPLELCSDNCPTWEWYDEWVSSNTTIANFIQQTYTIVRHKAATNSYIFDDHDLMAATVFLYPEVVTKRESRYVDVETCGTITQGQMVVDHRPFSRNVANVDLLLAVDRELLLQKWTDIVHLEDRPHRG